LTPACGALLPRDTYARSPLQEGETSDRICSERGCKIVAGRCCETKAGAHPR
jgi:hypothetical protein